MVWAAPSKKYFPAALATADIVTAAALGLADGDGAHAAAATWQHILMDWWQKAAADNPAAKPRPLCRTKVYT